MPKHWFILAIGIVCGIFIHLYLLSSEGLSLTDIKPLGTGLTVVICIGLTYLNTYFSDQLDVLFSWYDSAAKRMLISLIGYFFTSFLILYLFYISQWNGFFYDIDKPPLFGEVLTFKLAIVVFTILVLICLIQYAFFSYKTFVHDQINQTKLQREIADTQLEVLSSQLQPHFLFNSFNTISSLLHSNEEQAEDFIRKLAKTYEYTLDNYNEKWVSLSEELEFVYAFVEMMKVRFKNKLTLKVDVSEHDLKKLIMPLSLQLLIENAIKHNVISIEEPLMITINSNHQQIKVINNKTSTPSSVKSTKIGLSNLSRRYKLWTRDEMIVTDSEEYFSVQLPLN